MNSLMVTMTCLAWRDSGFVKDSLILQMLRLVNLRCIAQTVNYRVDQLTNCLWSEKSMKAAVRAKTKGKFNSPTKPSLLI